MESEKEIWIERTMNSLDGIQSAIPPVGMKDRILQRVQDQKFRIEPDAVKPATVYRAAAAILLIMALNIITCVIFEKSVSEKKGITSFAKEYLMTDSNDNFINI